MGLGAVLAVAAAAPLYEQEQNLFSELLQAPLYEQQQNLYAELIETPKDIAPDYWAPDVDFLGSASMGGTAALPKPIQLMESWSEEVVFSKARGCPLRRAARKCCGYCAKTMKRGKPSKGCKMCAFHHAMKGCGRMCHGVSKKRCHSSKSRRYHKKCLRCKKCVMSQMPPSKGHKGKSKGKSRGHKKKHMKCPPAVKKAGCCRTCHREIKKTGAPGRKCHRCIKRHHMHRKSRSCKSAHCKCHRTCHRIAKKLYKHAHRARRHAKKTKNHKMMKAVGKFFKHIGMKHKKCHRGCHPHKKHMKCPPAVKKAGCCRTCHREIKKTGAPGRKCHGGIKHHHKKHHSKRLKATLKTDKKKGRKHRCGGRCKCHRSCHRIAHKLYKHGRHAMKHAKKMKSKKMQSAVNKFMKNISMKHKKCHRGCNKGPNKIVDKLRKHAYGALKHAQKMPRAVRGMITKQAKRTLRVLKGAG